MHKKREEKMLPHGGGSGGDLIGVSVTTQSNECGIQRNPTLTSNILTMLLPTN